MKVLNFAPWWVMIIILDIICIDILYVGRYFFEGHAYNIAWSSNFGVRALFVIVVTAALIGKGTIVNGFFTEPLFILVCLLASALIGMLVQAFDRCKRKVMIMDRYHNLVVLPLLIFFMSLSVPIIYNYGTDNQKLFSAAMVIIWFILVVLDIKAKRMHQQSWLKRRGYRSPAW